MKAEQSSAQKCLWASAQTRPIEPSQRVTETRLHTTAMAKKRKDAAASAASTEKPTKPLVELSEEEQWRIIRESGVLQTVAPAGGQDAETEKETEEPLLSPFTEECFAALALIIPFCFLLLMMEM